MTEQPERFAEAIHVQMLEQLDVEDSSRARLIVYVFPLPAGEIVKELAEHLRSETHKWLLKKELVTEQMVNLVAQGPMQ